MASAENFKKVYCSDYNISFRSDSSLFNITNYNTISFMYAVYGSIYLKITKRMLYNDLELSIILEYNLTKIMQTQKYDDCTMKLFIDNDLYTFHPTYIEVCGFPFRYLKQMRIINEIFNVKMDRWLDKVTYDDILLYDQFKPDPYNGYNVSPVQISNMTKFAAKIYSNFFEYFNNIFPITCERFLNILDICTDDVDAVFIQNIIYNIRNNAECRTFISGFFKQDYEHKLQFVDIPIEVV